MENNIEIKKNRLNSVYIVIDTSFILKGILQGYTLDSRALLERCRHIKNISGRSLRFPQGVKTEMLGAIGECYRNENVREVLRIFHDTRHFPAIPNMEELHYFDFFKNKVEEIGKRLNNGRDKKDLSPIDINLGAYSILKTLKGEVILGTQDELLINSTWRVHDIASRVFEERKLSSRKLYLVRTCQDLENALENIRAIRNERRLISEDYKLEKYSFGFSNCSPS